MSITAIERRFYRVIDGNNSDYDEYIIPNGNKLYVTELGGSAAYTKDAKVQICFYPTECFFVTHGDSIQTADLLVEGDGTKYMRILLQNDSDAAETLGGFWKGYLVV